MKEEYALQTLTLCEREQEESGGKRVGRGTEKYVKNAFFFSSPIPDLEARSSSRPPLLLTVTLYPWLCGPDWTLHETLHKVNEKYFLSLLSTLFLVL